MKQEMTRFWDAVASAGPYADSLHLLQTDNHTNTPSLTRLKTKLKDTVCFYSLLFCKKKLQFWQGRNCDECSLTVSNEPPSVHQWFVVWMLLCVVWIGREDWFAGVLYTEPKVDVEIRIWLCLLRRTQDRSFMMNDRQFVLDCVNSYFSSRWCGVNFCRAARDELGFAVIGYAEAGRRRSPMT